MILTHRNVSASKHARTLARRAKKAAKVARNCSKVLGRIDRIVKLAPNFDRAKGNALPLLYVGTNPVADLARLERVLGKLDTNGSVTKEMGRITVAVTIKNLPVADAAPVAKAA